MTYPTADEAARIIIAAAREVGVDPLHVCDAEQTGVYLKRARAYAGLAIAHRFPDCPIGAVSRMVGVGHPPYIAIIRSKVGTKGLPWWRPEVLRRVIASVPPKESPEPDPCSTGSASPRRAVPEAVTRFETVSEYVRPASKRRLEEELRQAVENTARMARGIE